MSLGQENTGTLFFWLHVGGGFCYLAACFCQLQNIPGSENPAEVRAGSVELVLGPDRAPPRLASPALEKWVDASGFTPLSTTEVTGVFLVTGSGLKP